MRYRLGPYLVDSATRIVQHGDAEVRIPPKSVDLLLCLLEHSGGFAPKEALIAKLWPDSVVQESSLAQAVLALRRSLKEGFGDREIIQTIPRRGYRLTMTAIPEEVVSGHRTAEGNDVPVPLSAVDNSSNEASDMKRRAARRYGLIVVFALVMAGIALALTGFR